jgi:hypothetical protein
VDVTKVLELSTKYEFEGFGDCKTMRTRKFYSPTGRSMNPTRAAEALAVLELQGTAIQIAGIEVKFSADQYDAIKQAGYKHG